MKRGDEALTLILTALAVTGCGEAISDRNSMQVYDSAGARIVSLRDSDPPAWTVDSIPFVDIGTFGGKMASLIEATMQPATCRPICASAAVPPTQHSGPPEYPPLMEGIVSHACKDVAIGQALITPPEHDT